MKIQYSWNISVMPFSSFLIFILIILSSRSLSQPFQPSHIFTPSALTYNQNFDSLRLTSNLYPIGWKGFRIAGSGLRGATLSPTASDGNSVSGGVYNVGLDSLDRAMGMISSGSTVPAVGAFFLNETGSLITSFSIQTWFEQWRTGSSNTTVETTEFEYSFNALGVNDTNAIWTPVSSLNMVEIVQNSTVAQPINGNLPQFRQQLFGSSGSVIWPNQQHLHIRWKDRDDIGSDGMYALDDLSMNVQRSGIIKFNVDASTTGNLPSSMFLHLRIGSGGIAVKPMTHNGSNIWTLTDTILYGEMVRYNFSVSGTSGNVESLPIGCSINGARSITVTDTILPIVCYSDCLPNIVISGSPSFCQGDSVILNANVGNGLTYQWRLNGNDIIGSSASSYIARQGGTYTVLVTNANNCGSVSLPVIVTVNPLPIATITPSGSLSICQGDSVILNANTGSGLTYQWRFNDTNIVGATGTSYIVRQSGMYSLLVTNANNCTSLSLQSIVVVNSRPTASITPSGSLSFCQGDSVTLNANAGSGLTYQWRLNGNDIIGSSASSYIARQGGTYTVLVTNANNCGSVSLPAIVTINPLPIATITPSGSLSICQGDSVILNANTSTGLTYQWRFNDTNIVGATGTSYIVRQSGTYSLLVTNANNCTSLSLPSIVVVNSRPTASITPSGSLSFCQGDSVTLNANAGSGLTYQWRLNGNDIIGSSASSYIARQGGTYTVLVANANNCGSVSSPAIVTVNPLPIATITPSGSLSLCQGDSVILNANAGTGFSYQWLRNSNIIAGANSSVYTVYQNGNYTVQIINTNGCASISSLTDVVFQPNFAASQIIGQSHNIVPNQPYVYLVSQNQNRNYLWNVTNGAILSGQGTNAITVIWGNFLQGQVRLTETQQVCSNTIDLNILIGQGTSVYEAAKEGIQLYPNPNQGSFYLVSERPLEIIRIMNTLGQVVWIENFEGHEAKINLPLLPDGLYQVVIGNQVKKVIIRR